MREIEEMANAIEAEEVAEPAAPSFDDLIAELQNVTAGLAEAVGAMKAAAAADPEPVADPEPEAEAEPEPEAEDEEKGDED